jgi:predicted anti-sigma-YlaC factor YlaD
MGKFRDDPEFWRQHAEDVRIESELENCPGSRRAAQEIASQYDLIACRVEERTKGLEKRALRWSRFLGQNGGLAKVGSGFDYAANFSSLACVA